MKILSFLSVLIAFAFMSCNNTKDATNTNNPPATDTVNTSVDNSPASPVTGKRWILNELNGKAVNTYPEQNKQAYIMMDPGGQAQGNGGCNGIGGSYTTSGNDGISFSQLISTKMACPDMTLESDFQNALQSSTSFVVDGMHLTLKNAEGTAIAKFDASPK
ncbi:MAG: META domain-containing protein [Bacteroidota bacterium]|nr:META domain-containing protein [Bacteroidota bacterium]